MAPKEQVIEVTAMTVLQIGGYRVTIEPMSQNANRAAFSPPPTENPRNSTPREWQIAEAELQQRSHSPFEPPATSKVERLSFSPRAGGIFRAVGGASMNIAQVVGRDGSFWFVFDSRGRPFALRRIDLAWHALPPDPTSPVCGDVIVHHGANSTVAEVLGKAEVGGWAVTNNAGVSVHVLRSEAGRWMSLGMVEVE